MELDVYQDWLGIPDGPRPPDHYQLLRLVQFEDAVDKIRKNYKKLNAHVRKYATGQYSSQSQDLLNELAKAMLCLTDPGRKREYDEGQGREFEEEREGLGRKPTAKVLLDQGHLSREQVQEAEDFADKRGLSMRDAVVQMKLVDATTAAQALSQELGLPYLDLEDMIPDDSILDRVSRNIVKRNSILPLFVDEDILLVACVDEPTHELEDHLRLVFDLPMRAVIATPLAINQGIAKYYAAGMRDEAAAEQVASGGKKKPKKTATAKKPQRKAKQETQLSGEERRQQMQLRIIGACWGLIGAVLFDLFVLKPYVLPDNWPFPYVTGLIALPIAIWFAWTSYKQM